MLYVHTGHKWEAFSVPVGFLHGIGVFETLHFREGKFLFLHYHANRFYKACRSIAWQPPFSWEETLSYALYYAKHENLFNARVNLYLVASDLDAQPIFALRIQPWEANPFPLANPVRIGVYQEAHVHFSPWSAYKTTSRWLYEQAYVQAKRYQWHDSLLLSSEGHVAETSRCNIFWIKEGILYTPSLSVGCVGGVMRQLILTLAQSLGIAIQQGKFFLLDLLSAEEVFLTNVLRGIQPVWHIYGYNVSFRTENNILTQAFANSLAAWYE
ncbi:MAG: aminotransferase class IV [Bacteroidia bacterium]